MAPLCVVDVLSQEDWFDELYPIWGGDVESHILHKSSYRLQQQDGPSDDPYP